MDKVWLRWKTCFIVAERFLQVFRVPTTHDVLTALFHPSYPKSHFDILNLGLLAFQLALFAILPNSYAVAFFFVYFAFWRGAYDLGLGWVLTKQSKRRWIVREMNKKGWLDQERCPNVRLWIKKQLVGKMGKDYEFDVSISRRIRVLSDLDGFSGIALGIQHMAFVPPSR